MRSWSPRQGRVILGCEGQKGSSLSCSWPGFRLSQGTGRALGRGEGAARWVGVAHSSCHPDAVWPWETEHPAIGMLSLGDEGVRGVQRMGVEGVVCKGPKHAGEEMMMNNTAAPFADGSKGDSTSTAGAVSVEVTGRSKQEEGMDALLVPGLAMHEHSVCMLALWAARCGWEGLSGWISMGAGRGCSCNGCMGWVSSMRGRGIGLGWRTLCQEMPQRKAPKYSTHAHAYVFPPAPRPPQCARLAPQSVPCVSLPHLCAMCQPVTDFQNALLIAVNGAALITL